MRLLALILAAVLVSTQARADPPSVAVDIRPVHSLVAGVMDGVGVPVLLSEGQGSPHSAALRPSAAGALQAADLIVWVGPELTPWIARTADTLARDAQRLTLLPHPATRTWPARATDGFDHDHDHGHDDDHGGTGTDPHAWLDPRNAVAWVALIAEALAAADPANADRYEANATALAARLEALDATLAADLAPVKDQPFAVVHDAFQYFERRYDLNAAGALSPSDASTPGPASLRALRDTIGRMQVACVFVEPQTGEDLTTALTDGLGTRVAVLDPLGLSLAPGPDLYSSAMRTMTEKMIGCLS